MRLRTALSALALFLALALAAPAPAQESTAPASPAAAAAQSQQNGTLDTLAAALQSRHLLHEQLAEAEKALAAARTDTQRAALAADKEALAGRLATVEQTFDQIAAGVDLGAFAPKPPAAFDLGTEARDILAPLVRELKSLTARPREMDRLRNEQASLEERLNLAKTAAANVAALAAAAKDATLRRELESLGKEWEARAKELDGRLSVTRYQLGELSRDEKPLWDTVSEAGRRFFATRGKNLLFAALAFFAVLTGMRLLHRRLRRTSSFFRQRAGTRNLARFADLALDVFATVLAVLAALFTLYLAADWLLLSIAALLLLGLAWAARNTLPRFFGQAKLLMNLGAVREGERLLLDGLPYEVRALGFTCRLVNPELEGGELLLPIGELMDRTSRPSGEGEPFFPCRSGDWVLLSDGAFGRVVLQTPQSVVLAQLGGSRTTYPTADFLAACPTTLSTGFRVKNTVGVDYAHQAEATAAIPETLRHDLMEGLSAAGFKEQLVSIKAEFAAAAASSLDILVLADFTGEAAPKLKQLERLLARLATESCTKHGWGIPFNQLTVHMAKG
jgi:small-conductance mechanosensitive channel